VNEEALVIKARRGDRQAFAQLVTEHHARLVAAARALVSDAEAAQDISQEAFIEAYRSLPRLEHPRRFRSWLFSILRHRALNYLRAAGRIDRFVSLEEAEDHPAEPTGAGPSEPFEAIRGKLDRLSVRHQEILAAKYLEGLSYEEIAQSFGLSVNAVRVRCHRAKEKLRELLSQDEGLSPAAEGVGP